MRSLSIGQTVIASTALIGLAILGALGQVSGDALVAVYSTVAGGALGYVNGKKAGGSSGGGL